MLTARELRFDYLSTSAVEGPIVEFSEKEEDFNARYKEAESYLKGYPMDALRAKKAFICDMDGVIYHGNQLLPGVTKFLDWLRKEHKKFLFLTNSSERSPRELREKVLRLTVQINEEHFYTSALATAEFLARQCPDGSVFVIGEAGLTKALYDAGFSMNDTNPDYVVVGETRNYSYDRLERAVHLVGSGAKLSGVTCREDLERFAYRPRYILDDVGDIVP